MAPVVSSEPEADLEHVPSRLELTGKHQMSYVSPQKYPPKRSFVERGWTASQVELTCQYTKALQDSGESENAYIRALEAHVDGYAHGFHKDRVPPGPYDQRRIDHWSAAATLAHARDPNVKLRKEHGTPRRELSRLVYKLWLNSEFSEAALSELVARYWKMAVITLDEDRRLNKIARSTMYETPNARWAAAGIEFPKGSDP